MVATWSRSAASGADTHAYSPLSAEACLQPVTTSVSVKKNSSALLRRLRRGGQGLFKMEVGIAERSLAHKYTSSVAKTNTNGLRRLHKFAIGLNILHHAHGFGQFHALYAPLFQAHHASKLLPCGHFGCRHAETCGQNAVEWRRHAAALYMAQHRDPRFLARASGYGIAQKIGNRAGPGQGTLFRHEPRLQLMRDFGSLRHHDNGELLSLASALVHKVADVFDGERNLGNQDHMRASGDTRLHGDPAGIAAHYLDQHDAVMRFSRSVYLVDRIGRGVQRGIEPESNFGG